MLIYIRSKFKKKIHNYNHVCNICPRRNIRCFIPFRRDRCTKKTLIHGTSTSKNGFRWPIGQNVPSVKSFILRTPALPVRDTGFLAGKGVSVENIMLDDCSIAPDDSWVTVNIKQL